MGNAEDATLIGGPEKREIQILPWSPGWAVRFEEHARVIAGALGEGCLLLEHVGSTSVPGLGAKPIVDLLSSVVESILAAATQAPQALVPA